MIAEGRRDAIRVDDIGAYCDVEPMLLDSGQVGAALEARLPTASVDRTLRRLRSWLGGLTILVALAVALASALAARRVAAPIDALTTAAARLGGGDLDTAVAAVGFAEVATLGRVMDEMRERLRGLTTALRQRETERTAVLEGISEGVLAVDAQRRVRYLNPQAARMLGVAPDEAIGRECGDLLHPRLAPHERPCEERCPIVLARSSGVARATERLALEPARTTVVMSAAPHGDQQVVLLRDETEAEAGRRMRDAILASLSHELRTPLAAQLASIEMLRDRVAAGDATEIDPLVTSLERGTLRLTRLIDNLLESARIEAGYGAMRAQEVRIDEVVEEAIQQTAPLIHQRGQVLDVDLPFPVPLVKGDEQRLVQVVGNLLANAQKYAPDGATISLRVTADDRSMELRVDNPGPPLPQQAGDLFQPFVRARGAEPVQPGVGLGLWVVRSIVERHGGKVCALNVQGGVRFAVSLPRMAPAAPKIEP
ncbi:MAG: ATP-binding protein [Acidobacteriota bacterium]